MEKTLSIKINCGETTCASEPGKFCEYCLTLRFGTTFICSLFSSNDRPYYILNDNKNGWLMRCSPCLEMEEI